MSDEPTQGEQTPVEVAKTIFAFSVSVGGKPRVHEIPDTPEGTLTLANLIRTEQVLAVVLGESCSFQVESVVSVTVGKDRQIVDRMPLEPERKLLV